jgi:hypothetical protein
MIRPVTFVCMLLAAGSGLYLYQEKHRAQLLDREIAATVHAADAARERSGVLRAEWTLQNDPERLAGLADRFLGLKTVSPGQFTAMAELDRRLPAIRPPEPPPATAATDEPPVPSVAEPEGTRIDIGPPAPPKPETPKVVAGRSAPAGPTPAPAVAQPATRLAAATPKAAPERRAAVPPSPSRVAVAETRSVIAAVPAAARPLQAAPLPMVPPPVVTSVLGMARAGSLPPPVPFLPVSVGNGGG